VNGPEIEFDWDEANIGHVARHSVLPEEAEQIIIHNPVDLGMEIVGGAERYLSLGATVQGRVLLVVTTWRKDRYALSRRSNQSNGLFSSTIRNERGDPR
jgi:hypothetical protein